MSKLIQIREQIIKYWNCKLFVNYMEGDRRFFTRYVDSIDNIDLVQ